MGFLSFRFATSSHLGWEIRRESQMVRCASTQKFGTKETAHALVGGRVGTAVVVLVGMQSGFPARGVLREHGRLTNRARAGYP